MVVKWPNYATRFSITSVAPSCRPGPKAKCRKTDASCELVDSESGREKLSLTSKLSARERRAEKGVEGTGRQAHVFTESQEIVVEREDVPLTMEVMPFLEVWPCEARTKGSTLLFVHLLAPALSKVANELYILQKI